MAKSNKNKRVVLSDIFVSVVTIVDKSTGDIVNYLTNLVQTLANHYTNYEVIIIDNGMNAEQVEKIISLLSTVQCLRFIRLSRSYSRDTAVFSGLEASIGDFVCVLMPDLDQPSIITELTDINQSGIDIVQGVSNMPIDGGLVSRSGRALFYWYNRRYLAIDIPLNATYLVSFNRRAINALLNTNRNQRHLRHLSRRIGFKLATINYTPLRNPSNNRTLKTSILEALEIATSYSNHPLRFVTLLGIVAGLGNLIYAAYVVVVNLADKNVAAGWTTLSLQASTMFFFIFAILIVLSEYIGRILTESHREPQYYITEELSSTVAIADETRRNVTK